MDKQFKRIRYNPRRRMKGAIGERPGTISVPEDALKPIISIYSYNEKELVKCEGKSIDEVFKQLAKCNDHTHWIEVRGLGDAKLIEHVGSQLNINPLVLEDISNIHQRPKFDEYDDYVFAVSRLIHFN